MRCFNCGLEIGDQPVCPNCGGKMETYRRILLAAGAWYNDGLRRAQVRDLSGAIESLKQALRFNKYHTDARNLLGLCYYEIGETVEALAEWVISKNLQPDGNRVDRYLQELQGTAGELDRMRSAVKKYNMAVKYCRDGNRDLAKIQLRRVTGTNPRMVKAQQLLALLLIQEENYAEARKCLLAANRIDGANTITLRYLREVRAGLREQMAHRGSRRRQSADVIEIQDGNDLILTPRFSLLDRLSYTQSSLLTLVAGLVIGLLVFGFLIMPTLRTNDTSRTAKALVQADALAQSYDKNMADMSARVTELEAELAQYVGKADIVGSYEGLTAAARTLEGTELTTEDYDTAAQILEGINRDLLGETGQASYDALNERISEYRLEQTYLEGYRANRQGYYDQAKELLGSIVTEQPEYGNGNALHYLADSYDKTSDPENAIFYYRQLLNVAPGSEFASTAREYVQRWGDTYPERTVQDAEEPDAQTVTEETDAASTDDTAATGNTTDDTTEDADEAANAADSTTE